MPTLKEQLAVQRKINARIAEEKAKQSVKKKPSRPTKHKEVEENAVSKPAEV